MFDTMSEVSHIGLVLEKSDLPVSLRTVSCRIKSDAALELNTAAEVINFVAENVSKKPPKTWKVATEVKSKPFKGRIYAGAPLIFDNSMMLFTQATPPLFCLQIEA